MASEKNKQAKNLAFGTLIAAVVGYLVGLFTAPQSGKQTRNEVVKKANDVKSEAEAKLQKAHDELADLIDQAKAKATGLKTKAKAEVNDAADKAKVVKRKASGVLVAVSKGKADDKDLSKAINNVKKAKGDLANYLKKR